ncbi:transposase [Sedimentitalea nanhaiensis]|uniref:transposase n=1 Tax=Sedimentitalea nanhaiensis TaxID=999627 RepID=UPI0012B5C06A
MLRLVDSLGLEDEWTAGKHGGPKRRVWRKIHLGTDERTLEVRAFEIRGGPHWRRAGSRRSAPPDPSRQRDRTVTADGACDTRKCHDAIADRGANAVIPPAKCQPVQSHYCR